MKTINVYLLELEPVLELEPEPESVSELASESEPVLEPEPVFNPSRFKSLTQFNEPRNNTTKINTIKPMLRGLKIRFRSIL